MKKKQSYADRIVAIVDQMKVNGEEMRTWANIPLAKEVLELVRNIPEEEEENELGKAYALNAVMEKLSEYDTPRLALEILREELAQLQASDEKSDWLTEEDINSDIARLEDYIDLSLSNEEFCKKHYRHLEFDPVERTPEWEENIYEAQKEADAAMGDSPRGMGFCHGFWPVLKAALSKRGIRWQTPHELNPRVMFD